MKSAFLKVGNLPTLIACFLYFDLSFAVWVLLGPLAIFIADDLHLDPGQKGLMVATPVSRGRCCGSATESWLVSGTRGAPAS